MTGIEPWQTGREHDCGYVAEQILTRVQAADDLDRHGEEARGLNRASSLPMCGIEEPADVGTWCCLSEGHHPPHESARGDVYQDVTTGEYPL